jgi:UDP-N-acetylmuramoyl-tripeptide--D-alanyl-D-alanine ligase
MDKLNNDDTVIFNSENFAEWVNGTPQLMPPAFRGVTQNTRILKPGMLYVALRGEKFDGHDFVESALQNGAVAAMVEHDHPFTLANPDKPLLLVDSPRRALLDAAGAWRLQSRAKIIGITGSCGKTTAKEMAAALCSLSGRVCATQKNLNNDIGLPLSLLSMPPNCDFGIFEIGTSHPGEIKNLSRVLNPDIGIITSVGTAHIENFGSSEAIVREKASLTTGIKSGGCLVLSMDDEYYEVLKNSSDVPVFTVSLRDNSADYFGELTDLLAGRITITERCSRLRVDLHSNMPGEYNAINLLLAYAAVRLAGVDGESATPALHALAMPDMRWQRVVRRGAVIINDAYNANPQSVSAALGVFRQLSCGGRKILVLGDMLELGKFAAELHRAVGAAAAEIAPHSICLIGKISAEHTLRGALENGFPQHNIMLFNNASEAGDILKKFVVKGDLLLLKASRGMHLEDVLEKI